MRFSDEGSFVKYGWLLIEQINGDADVDVWCYQPVVVIVPLLLAFVVIACF